MMIRKNIYLSRELNQRLRIFSQQRKRTEAEVIRELLEEGISKRQDMTAGEALLRLADLGKQIGFKGPADLSVQHDDYLYGNKE